MIQKIRIDDRLLHGQVAYSWKSALNYEAIVIASDDAASDPIRKQALKLAKPDGVKLAIRSIDEAIALLNNEKLKGLKVFVVTASPHDALKLYQGIDETPVCTLGGVQMKDGRKAFAPAVYFTPEELGAMDNLITLGIFVEVKQVPDDKGKDFSDLRQKYLTQ
ncbi:PTS system mannose/fructose/sorbose family transporter subunit IIB [Erysipelothrix rhusiopathiae SY1027]|uniref:PTS system mannose/fructose/N-acetylgalactosamine-transporter subunit IIB n=1 Tax=Erysipelothrix rhusiopathiae TaxID=1648 RepID=UPI0003348787|nr:PTS sugar transporter subunit IIB [Erysipelothrix rhusiopathiae]AGN25355.1 PTS system mannose/fructose/sorbose family transporter subunit IIB [Erysipelothrix rhusiopathiae SY1027]